MIWFLIVLAVIGLIAGFIARAVVPGRDPMGVGATMLLGVAGSLIGGFIGWALFGKDLADGAIQTSGIIGSIVGAIVALLIYRSVSERSGNNRRLFR